MKEMLKSVPAYALPKDQQVDHFFPHASKAFLGYYIPLFEANSVRDQDQEEDNDIGIRKKVMGCTSLGLSGRDTFCVMTNRANNSDLLYIPVMFDMNEVMEVIEQAWKPRDRNTDPDNLNQYRYDSIMRWAVPANNDEAYQKVKKTHEADGEWGPKHILFRLPKDREESGFVFKKVFPKTYAMLQSGKYRWFQYKSGVLRIIIGPGKGYDKRSFESNQVLKTWKYDFESFHDMLCVVEASWVRDGQDLSPDVYLDEFDHVVEVSIAPTLATDSQCIAISTCNELKKFVTALALTDDPNGKPILYSGHDDGTLIKWSLENDVEVWSKQIYADGRKDFERFFRYGLHVMETPGVAGIVIRPDPTNKHHHLVYTWSDAYEGYPHRDFDDRGPATLRAWSGNDGKLVKKYLCDVGVDADGDHAHPSISTVVFCKLCVNDVWVDSIIVGMHCLSGCLQYDNNFSYYDIEEAAELSGGNILPFWEHSSEKSMETWRGDPGLIRAMAVVDDKYLFTISVCPGHGFAHHFTLWSLLEPGIPLIRKDLRDESRPLLRQDITRMHEIVGISTVGTTILIANERAAEIAVVTIAEDYGEDGDPSSIDIRGYGTIEEQCEMEIYHGRMAMSKDYSIVANEKSDTVWIYDINKCVDHKKLDTRDGSFKDLRRSNRDDEDRSFPGTEIAVGKIEFPLWGANKPAAHKRQKQFVFPIQGSLGQREYDDDDCFGEGGPVALAIRGQWIVAGFSNGSISKALLPEQFVAKLESSIDVSSNHLASCSYLCSSEWHLPQLACAEDSGDDESDEVDAGGDY